MLSRQDANNLSADNLFEKLQGLSQSEKKDLLAEILIQDIKIKDQPLCDLTDQNPFLRDEVRNAITYNLRYLCGAFHRDFKFINSRRILLEKYFVETTGPNFVKVGMPEWANSNKAQFLNSVYNQLYFYALEGAKTRGSEAETMIPRELLFKVISTLESDKFSIQPPVSIDLNAHITSLESIKLSRDWHDKFENLFENHDLPALEDIVVALSAYELFHTHLSYIVNQPSEPPDPVINISDMLIIKNGSLIRPNMNDKIIVLNKAETFRLLEEPSTFECKVLHKGHVHGEILDRVIIPKYL